MAAKIEVDPETGCWLWTGSCNEGQSGYGQVSYEGEAQLVHRVVFRLLVGDIPEGFQVRHADAWGRHFTLCCNPDHLEAVPKKEALRRRDWESARARRTHRPHGHAGELVSGSSRVPAVPDVPRRGYSNSMFTMDNLFLKKY
ncbi:MAG: HNH endonuclease [Moorella sp. (in: Bacteria)]|nr:HNH endonuclease [Moorella sp. (in: firmicutes)]